jgi:hypothetical protein
MGRVGAIGGDKHSDSGACTRSRRSRPTATIHELSSVCLARAAFSTPAVRSARAWTAPDDVLARILDRRSREAVIEYRPEPGHPPSAQVAAHPRPRRAVRAVLHSAHFRKKPQVTAVRGRSCNARTTRISVHFWWIFCPLCFMVFTECAHSVCKRRYVCLCRLDCKLVWVMGLAWWTCIRCLDLR